MELSKRQEQILEIVKRQEPITGDAIADQLKLARATLRPDLAILTMSGYLDARPRVGYFYKERRQFEPVLELLNGMKVMDYLSSPVVVEEEVSAYDAVCTMFLEDVGTLFVVDQQGILVGVVSRKDFLRASIGNHDLQSIPVHMIMTRMPNITTCMEEDSLVDVTQKLVNNQIDAIPVVNKKNEVIGRMTKTNITKAFLKLTQE